MKKNNNRIDLNEIIKQYRQEDISKICCDLIRISYIPKYVNQLSNLQEDLLYILKKYLEA